MKKVMVVDDDEGIIEFIRQVLEPEGVRVIPALSGKECLQKLRSIKPDCIILDIMLADIEGWEVLKRIKADENLKSIPVLILTVKPLSTQISKGIDTKSYEYYMLKPFTKGELLDVLGRVGVLPPWAIRRY